MALPAPRLDDRTFQDLVDDAKRYIRERCPTWTDHNVSDPGITLIEAFAWMTDLLLYRLNRVPDRVQVKFLDMIGVQLFPPSAATVDVDFRLAARQDVPLTIPRGTLVSTARVAGEVPVEFSTTRDLDIEVAQLVYVGTGGPDGPATDVTAAVASATGSSAVFSATPAVDDAFYIGLDRALPGHSVRLRLSWVRGAGGGIRTAAPPIAWEALVDGEWVACDWSDHTRGLNVDGTVDVHIPHGHQMMDVDSPGLARVGMIRCRVRLITAADARLGMTAYRSSPMLRSATVQVVGATVEAINARFVEREVLGVSRGVPGQEFQLQHAPVIVSDEALVVTVDHPLLDDELTVDGGATRQADVERWESETWELVTSFSDSGPDDRHFVLDRSTGTVRFGPMVREEDGQPRSYGAFPAKGSVIGVPRYRVGGGREGNVAVGAIQVLRTSIPSIARVGNRRPGAGGADGETVEEATTRGPIELRSRNRAVTTEDFEALTREADPLIRRARCIVDPEQPHTVRVLMVPAVGAAGTQLTLDELEPSPETCARVEAHLDARRLVGTRVRTEPPEYAGLRVKAEVIVEERYDAAAVREAALSALYVHFDPLVGGRDGRGWEFGRHVRVGEVFGVLQRVAGVDVVTAAAIFFCDSQDGTGEEDVGATLDLLPHQLVLSREHEIVIAT